MTAIDVSPDALALARENAARTGLTIELLEHDLRAGLPGGPYDLVVSNPPYVEPDELPTLMPDVREYEPHLALVGSGRHRGSRPRAHWRCSCPVAGSCSRWATGRRPRPRRCSTGSATPTSPRRPDLTGRDRVVEGRRV